MLTALKPYFLGLVMPPTGLLTVIVVGLLLSWFWRRTGRLLVWLGVIGLYLLATPVVSQSLMVALERDLPMTPPADNPPQAIVVLGGELIRSQSVPGHVHLGPLSAERVQTAAALARRTGLPILVSGGLIHADIPAVGAVMAQALRDDYGITARWQEDRSPDTWENARFSAALLKQAGINSIYLVTTAWHMRRALLSFEGLGLTVTAAPTALDQPVGPLPTDFVPYAASWLTSYYALHEWIGYAWYRLR